MRASHFFDGYTSVHANHFLIRQAMEIELVDQVPRCRREPDVQLEKYRPAITPTSRVNMAILVTVENVTTSFIGLPCLSCGFCYGTDLSVRLNDTNSVDWLHRC